MLSQAAEEDEELELISNVGLRPHTGAMIHSAGFAWLYHVVSLTETEAW